MIFNRGDKKRLLLTTTFSVDPADMTLTLLVDGTPRACEWLSAATKTGSQWTRQARTTEAFAGPDAELGSAVLLSAGAHVTKMRASNSDTTVTALTDLIFVR